MKTDIKSLLEYAGVDTTKGTAKKLINEVMELTPEDKLVNKIKDQIDPLFDSEDGREALEDLAIFIQSNLN